MAFFYKSAKLQRTYDIEWDGIDRTNMKNIIWFSRNTLNESLMYKRWLKWNLTGTPSTLTLMLISLVWMTPSLSMKLSSFLFQRQ